MEVVVGPSVVAILMERLLVMGLGYQSHSLATAAWWPSGHLGTVETV